MIIDTPILRIEAVLSDPVTTNELPIAVSYSDGTRIQTAEIVFLNRTITDGTTDVTILGPPSNKEKRLVKNLTICNLDTVDATIELKYDDGTTETCIIKVTLEPNDTLQFTQEEGFRVISTDGGVKGSPGLVAHADTTGQTTDDHHTQAHTLASHSTKDHNELTSVTPDQHHAQVHSESDHSAPPIETLNKSAVDVVVDNTVVETSVVSFTLAAGKLGTNNIIDTRIFARLDNTPGAETLTIRVKYGATTIISDVFVNPSNAAILPLNIHISLIANDATGAQVAQMSITEEGEPLTVAFGTAAEDSTTALTFEVTVQHSTAGAGITYTQGYTISQLQR